MERRKMEEEQRLSRQRLEEEVRTLRHNAELEQERINQSKQELEALVELTRKVFIRLHGLLVLEVIVSCALISGRIRSERTRC